MRAIPKRSSVVETLSGHQERLRRLELRSRRGGFQQVEFEDGTFSPGWSGRLRASSFKGSHATGPRVYLDIAATRATGVLLTIGVLPQSAWPGRPLYVWSADAGGNPIKLTIDAVGNVSASAYGGFTIIALGATLIP